MRPKAVSPSCNPIKRKARLIASMASILVWASLAAASPANNRYWSADIHQQPVPGIRLASGVTVCDEVLSKGRWMNRYWLSTGFVEPERHFGAAQDHLAGQSVDGFQLAIEGQDLSGSWRWVKAEKSEVHNPDGLEVTLELASDARAITVKVHTLLYGGPVMVRWLEVINTGKKPTAITAVSPWSGLMWDMTIYQERLPKGTTSPFEVGYAQYEVWGHEGAWKFEPVENTTKTVSGTRGKSGWGHPTFFAHNKATGEWFVASLGWSGNWTYQVTGQQSPDTDRATMFFRMGPTTVDSVLRVLEPGESVATPRTHILCMRGDLDSVIQSMHEHVRHEVLPPPVADRDMLVEGNHRGYIVDHETEAGIDREIDLAAEAGAEMFVIDAGWYGQEPNRWAANVGDWYAGDWLPNDINPIREHARQKGLLFGLWVEIESIGSNSKLRQQHPDWVLTRDGKPVARGRQLDVANPQVAAWMESEIGRIIKKYDLDLFRIDYNTTTEEDGNHVRDGFVENSLWRHVDALYAMFDRLHGQFPHVIFQNCAGGGGRLDLGIMQRFQNTELSDWLRAPRGLKILNGMTWILPPEILLRTFGTESNGVQSDADLVTQLRATTMALPIFRGLVPPEGEFNPLQKDEILHEVNLYKQVIRPILKDCRVYHHTPLTPMLEGTPWMVMEYASADSLSDLGWVFRTDESGDPTYWFRPRGLDLGKTYNVTFSNSDRTVAFSGSQLLESGVPVRLEGNLTSELLIFKAQ